MDITENIRQEQVDLLADIVDDFGKGAFEVREQYKPGDLIWWSDKWVCSGYYPPIKAMFIKYYRSRVGIAVAMRDGTWIPKKVTLPYIEERRI